MQENFIPRVFKFQGFKTTEIKEWLSKGYIEISLKPEKDMKCFRCGSQLKTLSSTYPMNVRHLNVFFQKCILKFKRRKGYCPSCNKERSEEIEFLSDSSPHITKDFAWFLFRLCEISSVTKAAELTEVDPMLAYRIDYKILLKLIAGYKIPVVRRISVDEVYARRKKKKGENRSDLFMTVITDLKTHKAIYVSQGRRKEALDEFFILLGIDACRKIKVVACDQYDGYRLSVEQYCPNAVVIWDRFHLMQNFNEAVNEATIAVEDLLAGRKHGFLRSASQ